MYVGFRPVLEVLNTDPLISDTDRDLGDKNSNFTIEYTVNDADGDALTVKEELNGSELRTINNAPKGETLSISLTSEQLYNLALNSVNTIKITVTDGKGGTAYRILTFKHTNSAPSISGQDTDLGLKSGSFAQEYVVTDIEADNMVATEYIDGKKLRSYQATLGATETIERMSEQNGMTYLTPKKPVSEIQRDTRRNTSAQEVAALMFVKMAQEAAEQALDEPEA